MRNFLSAAILVMLFISASPSAAEVVSRKFTLDNGLTVIVNEMPSTSVAAVYAWVKTGSANEGQYLGSGITHFVEHMIFKGTARRGPGMIPAEAKSLGGDINASTGHDFTVFTLALPKENFAKGVDLIADMMRNATFDPQEVERERDVIRKEMRMINDKPDRKLDDLVNANVYNVHPYRLPIIGRESIFKAITRDDLAEYYRTYYAPNNMIVSVAGQFTAEEVLPIIKEKFGDAVARSTPLRDLPSEPEQISPRTYEETYPTDLYRLVLAYQGVPLLHHDLYALDLLAGVLGGGQSSRFYRRLYEEKRLVNSVSVWNDTPMDRGFFGIACLMKDDRREDVIREVKAMIAEVKKDGLKPEELAKIKRQSVVENIKSRMVASGTAYRSALEEAFTGDHRFSDSYVEGIKAVTNDDIKRVAREYLNDNRLTEVSLVPPSNNKTSALAPTIQATVAEKMVLPNGLTILLKEDRTLPTVSFNVMLRAGIQEEPETLAGLALLTGAVWDKSYQGLKTEDLSREIEARGGSVGSGSGRSTMALNLSFLSDDLPFALDVLEKLVKFPAFPADAIDRERQQMISAIAGRKDSVMQTASKELMETIFKTHPFRRDGLGTEESLKKITRQDIVTFYDRFVVPSNLVVAIFGDIDKARLKEELVRRLGSLPKKDVRIQTFTEPPPESRREREIAMDKEQAALLFGFRAPVISSPEGPAVDVAVNVLSSSLSGRLFKRIRDELGKAYAVGGSFSPGVDVGVVTFYALTTNDNVAKVRSIIEEELEKLANEPVTDTELGDTKVALKADHARDLETIYAQSASSTTDELLGLGYDFEKDYDRKIDAVTAEAVRTAARKYLLPANAAVVVVKGNPTSVDKNN